MSGARPEWHLLLTFRACRCSSPVVWWVSLRHAWVRNPIGDVFRYSNTASRCGLKGIDVDIMSTSGMTYIQMLGTQ